MCNPICTGFTKVAKHKIILDEIVEMNVWFYKMESKHQSKCKEINKWEAELWKRKFELISLYAQVKCKLKWQINKDKMFCTWPAY